MRVRLFAKKAIVLRRCPERDGDESWAARGRGQLDLRDRPASYKNKTKEALCSLLQRLKGVFNYSNSCSHWPAKCFSGIEQFS